MAIKVREVIVNVIIAVRRDNTLEIVGRKSVTMEKENHKHFHMDLQKIALSC